MKVEFLLKHLQSDGGKPQMTLELSKDEARKICLELAGRITGRDDTDLVVGGADVGGFVVLRVEGVKSA